MKVSIVSKMITIGIKLNYHKVGTSYTYNTILRIIRFRNRRIHHNLLWALNSRPNRPGIRKGILLQVSENSSESFRWSFLLFSGT